MKKVYSIVFFLSLITFITKLRAQVCDGVTASTFMRQADQSNYFGIKISLRQTSSEDITVREVSMRGKVLHPGMVPFMRLNLLSG